MFSSIVKKPYLIILLGFLFPPFAYVALQQSSNAAGVLLIAFFTIVFYIKSLPRYISYRFIYALIIFLLYCIISIFRTGEFFKVTSSWVMFFFLVGVYGHFLTRKFFFHDEIFVSTVKVVYFFLVGLGVFSLIYRFPFLGYEHRPANVFPFSEHSHYSVAYSFFAFNYQLYVRNNKGFLTSLVTIFLGVSFPSLTMIIIGLMLAFILIIKNRSIFLVIFFVFVVSPGFLYFSEYFLSRLVFDSGKLDLSNLVYLQGWEGAWIGLQESYGIGLGFQALGTQAPGVYTELIRSVMNGFDLNRNDGGFLASKFIGEFGVFGVIICFIVLFNFFKVVTIAQNDRYKREPLTVIYMSLSLVMFIEFFVRGFGYFSPAFILFASFFLQKTDCRIKFKD